MKASPDCSLPNYDAWLFKHNELLSIRCQRPSNYTHNTFFWGHFLLLILITLSKYYSPDCINPEFE